MDDVEEYVETETCKTYTPNAPLSPNSIHEDTSPTQNPSQLNLLQPACQHPVDPLDQFCTPDASWAELIEIDETLRQPGGAAKIHEKLSSPSRRKTDSSEEARKRYEERHQRAEKRRFELEEKKKN